MNPLEIDIVLHYYTRPGNYRDGDLSATSVDETIKRFLDDNVLEERESPVLHLTERGEVFVKALCSVPLPIQKWVMPEDSK